MNDVVTFLIYIIYFISRNQLERLDKSGLGVDIPVSYTHLDVYKRQNQLLRFRTVQSFLQPGKLDVRFILQP